VCTENLVRFDLTPESLNVDHNGRADILPLEPGRLDLQAQERLEAENAALRQQLIVLQRKLRGRVQFTNSDRLFFIQLYRWCPSVLKAMGARPARDTCVLAPRRASPLLAPEIPLHGRPATNSRRIAGVDLADEC
jgi:hypothetical protein